MIISIYQIWSKMSILFQKLEFEIFNLKIKLESLIYEFFITIISIYRIFNIYYLYIKND